MSVWKDWLSTPFNNYCRSNHRTGSEVLILEKHKCIFKKRVKLESHSKNKPELSVSILELLSQHQESTPPLQMFHHTLETWKPALCTQGYRAEIKKPRPPVSKSEDTSHWSTMTHHLTSPQKGQSQLTRNCSQCLWLFNWSLQKYYRLWLPEFDCIENKQSLRNLGEIIRNCLLCVLPFPYKGMLTLQK